MTAAQFQARLKRAAPPVTLLLGPEAYQRRLIRETMLQPMPPDAIARHDLAEVTLAEVVDDARALSLFASERVIWVTNAELALPKGRAAAGDDDDETGPAGAGGAEPLAAYIKDPTPGVSIVFEAIRFDFEGDDKRK